MKKIKLIGLLIVAVLFTTSLVLPWEAFAQDAPAVTNAPSGTNTAAIGDISDKPLPVTKADLWMWVIAAIVPFIMAGIKYVVPRIPPLLIPVSTPLVGLALGAGLNYLGQSNLSWMDMAQAGGLAVVIRESWDQALKSKAKKLVAEEKTPPYAPID